MNFSKYWDKNKIFFNKLNVDRDIAKKIWLDCLDVIEEEINKLNKK
jgi:hypothetical protein